MSATPSSCAARAAGASIGKARIGRGCARCWAPRSPPGFPPTEEKVSNTGKANSARMKLYLLQHGDALLEEVNPDRPLSERGLEDVRRLAEFVWNHGIHVKHVYHSGKTR